MAKTTTPAQPKAPVIREEDLQDMEELQREVEGRIENAHNDGRVYMMAQYVRILAMVSSEVKRVRARFNRDNLAAHNKALLVLKKSQRGQDDEPEDEA